MISLIVAVDENGCIGINGKMPWHIPEELKHFKEYTWNKKVLVGRKTYESIGKPLKNRKVYVLSHDNILDENIEVIHNLDLFIKKYKNYDEELVVIGGSQIYEMMMDHVDKMVISVIKTKVKGDTYFPKFDINDFILVSKQENEKYDVYTFIRKEEKDAFY